MQSIEVIVSESGKPKVVNSDCPVVRTGDYVEWVFHSANPHLTHVEVEFKSKKAQFFPNENEKHKCKKEVGPHKNAVLLGRVPYDNPGYKHSIHDKYTVRGYFQEEEDLKDKPKNYTREQDPEIFTKKP